MTSAKNKNKASNILKDERGTKMTSTFTDKQRDRTSVKN